MRNRYKKIKSFFIGKDMSVRIYAVLFSCIVLIFLLGYLIYAHKNGTRLYTADETQLEGYTLFSTRLKELYGAVNLVISPNEINSNGAPIIRAKNGFLGGSYGISTNFDPVWAADKVSELEKICRENGTDFLYVHFPSKMRTDIDVKETYGIDSDSYEARNLFLDRLQENKVNELDISSLMKRDGIKEEDWDSVFYKTDHHWNTRSGLYAAGKIADYIDKNTTLNVKPDMLEPDKFRYKAYKNSWLGETGRACSATWSRELDDFTEILPKYKTSITCGYRGTDQSQTGDFGIMVNVEEYKHLPDIYDPLTLHYTYCYSGDVIKNNLNPHGTSILIIKDSFTMVVAPFLSLATGKVTLWDMRSTPDGLYDYIKNNHFDMVIVEYTDWFGNHMYDFK